MTTESVSQAHRYRRYYQRLEPLFKSPQAQAYTMVILSLFTIAFFGIFAIRPTLKTIAALQRKIGDNTEVDQKLEEKINALIQAQDTYQRMEPDLPLIYSLLPDKPEFPSLFRRIENLAIDHDATISAIQFDPIVLYAKSSNTSATPTGAAADTTTTSAPTAAATQTTPMFFSLVFGGNYEKLLELLDRLTKLDRLITIQSVGLSPAGTAGGSSTLTVTIQSRAYYYSLTL